MKINFENFDLKALSAWRLHMVILRSQNKITDFLMILAWACPFNATSLVYMNYLMPVHFGKE